MDDERIVGKLAHSFNVTTGMEYEDNAQEARLAMHLAGTGGSYDPRKSSLNTFKTNCASRRLCTLAEHHRRTHPQTVELSEFMVDGSPNPEQVVMFRDQVRNLSEDAQLVVEMILTECGSMIGLTPNKVKSFLRSILPWKPARIERAFRAIAEMLAGL